MIRRTFLKALCASPLGFLIPKAKPLPGRRFTKGTTGGANVDEIKRLFRDGQFGEPFRVFKDGGKVFTLDNGMVMLKVDP